MVDFLNKYYKKRLIFFLLTSLTLNLKGQEKIFLSPIYEKIIFVDDKPNYKAQCKGTYIDKVIYSENHVVISFRYALHELKDNEKNYVSLFAQDNINAWVLNNSKKTTKKHYIFLEKLINIKADTSLLFLKTENKQVIEFTNLDKRGKEDKIDNITCQLVFYYPPKDWEKWFLIEVPNDSYRSSKFDFYDLEIKYRKE